MRQHQNSMMKRAVIKLGMHLKNGCIEIFSMGTHRSKNRKGQSAVILEAAWIEIVRDPGGAHGWTTFWTQWTARSPPICMDPGNMPPVGRHNNLVRGDEKNREVERSQKKCAKMDLGINTHAAWGKVKTGLWGQVYLDWEKESFETNKQLPSLCMKDGVASL